MKRKIIKINEELCNGCGKCVTACDEGALKIIGGKARLVNEIFCDGLGACIGDCPTGALIIVEEDAPAFDEAAVEVHLKAEAQKKAAPAGHGGCPGSMAAKLRAAPAASCCGEATPSRLTTWPVQLKLVNPRAPFFDNGEVVIAADCTAFAMGDFHSRYLGENKVLLIACPKLDDGQFYIDKLTSIFENPGIVAIRVLIMEVPCCGGLQHIVETALKASGSKLQLEVDVISLRGEIV